MTALIFGGAFVVLAIVVIFLISTLTTAAAGQPISAAPVSSSVLNAVTHVTPAQFAAAGTGAGQVTVKNVFAATPKQPLLTQTIGTQKLPVLAYEGAEYCPYCAATRWPLIIALSRFGTFTGLATIGSSPNDVYAATRTFTFAKAHYTSKYLVFDPTEFESNVCAVALSAGECPNADYKQLQAASKSSAALFATYDTTKYFPGGTTGGIPFIDWGGLLVSSGSAYSPSVINPGNSTNYQGWHPLSWDQVVAALKTPSTIQAEAILGTANLYTAAICDMTHDQPASVCNTPVVKQLQAQLPS